MAYEELLKSCTSHIETHRIWGRISAIEAGVIRIKGLGGLARIGDRVETPQYEGSAGEIISVDGEEAQVMPSAPLNGVAIGSRVYLVRDDGARPCAEWLGRVLNSDGRSFDGAPTPQGDRWMSLNPKSLPASKRRRIGARVKTGLAPFDTFLPLCRGQRIGLFAGSGVGKSTLLADLAKGVDADVVVVGLIGERGREVGEFVEETLGPEGLKRSVVIAATSDEPAPSKRRAALLAATTAEYFRDQGLHVLLLFDSITRFAESHREIALTGGETPSLRAYPPSTFRALASLAERSGPGLDDSGDITAVYSVLVAGSDMEEPVADMVRGILDGHVILERTIAERGRFPAIDVRRSVSRSLPKAASDDENALLLEARGLIAAYEDAAAMIQTGLYAPGADPTIDRAVALWPYLDQFIGLRTEDCEQSFGVLAEIMAQVPQAGAEMPPEGAQQTA